MRRILLASSVFLAASSLGALQPARSAVLLSPVTYTFSGDCEDCSGTGTATMVLQPTQAGQTEFDSGNASLISFTYQSNLISSTTVQGTGEFYANMVNIPGQNDVYVVGSEFYFNSYSGGNWCVNADYCGVESLDFGYSHVWNAASTVTATPEPVSMSLLGTGLMGLLITRRFLRT